MPADPAQPTHKVWIDFDRRVPMRDGVTLSADIYRPQGDGRHPVILRRTPYLKTSQSALDQAR
ncbi:MAG: CocE/NonD family hydrolase, partial [Roseiflexaceae bacterium]